MQSDLHNGFPLLPFYDYGFNKSTHSARDRIMLKDSTGSKYDILVSHQNNGLD